MEVDDEDVEDPPRPAPDNTDTAGAQQADAQQASDVSTGDGSGPDSAMMQEQLGTSDTDEHAGVSQGSGEPSSPMDPVDKAPDSAEEGLDSEKGSASVDEKGPVESPVDSPVDSLVDAPVESSEKGVESSEKGEESSEKGEESVGSEAGEPPANAEPPAKRRKKKKGDSGDVSRFFETEAEEAQGSDDEDEAGDLEGLIDREAEKPPTEEELAAAEEAMDRPRSGNQNFLDKLEEKYTKLEEEKHKPAPPSPAASEGKWSTSSAPRGGIITHITPQSTDPKLWCCKTFAPEKELCIALLLKAGECISSGKPCPIFTAFWYPTLKGYIYVEAHKENDIRTFCKGIRGISPWQIKLVPTAQMAQVFNSAMNNAATAEFLKVGDWVRLKRGLYKADLAQIIQLEDEDATVKLKPRIDLDGQKNKQGDAKYSKRPIPRWFNRTDVEQHYLINTSNRTIGNSYQKFFEVNGENYRDGFLVKVFKTHWFETGDVVRPQEHEIQDWRNAPPPSAQTRPEDDLDEDDSKKMPPPPFLPTKKTTAVETVPLLEGDQIIVIAGDIFGNRGVVTVVSADQPTVLCKMNGISEPLTLAIERLCKYFEIGDHVRVYAGEHLDDSGTITKVWKGPSGVWSSNATATVLADTMDREFKVRCNHLRVSILQPAPQDEAGEFQVGTMARYRGKEVGMLIRIEARTRAIILLTDGKRHAVSLGALQPMAKLGSRQRDNIWALDRAGRKLSIGAVVKAPHSMQKTAPIKAQVQYIYSGYVFLKASELLVGDKAYIVCKSDRCEFVYIDEKKDAAKGKSNAEDDKKVYVPRDALGVPLNDDYEPAVVKAMRGSEIVHASQIQWLGEKFKKDLREEPVKASEAMFAKSKPVRIFGGPYKGLRAEVREWLGQTVRLSLLPKPKLVEVSVAYVGPDIFYDSPKSLRFPEIKAPATPKMDLGSASPGQSESPDEIGDWDPKYGIEAPPRNPALNTEVPLDVSENPTTTTSSPVYGKSPKIAPAPATPDSAERSAKRRRREPKLPNLNVSPGSVSSSPSKTPPPKWAVPGVVVNYIKDGKTSQAVIKQAMSAALLHACPFGTDVRKGAKMLSHFILKIDDHFVEPVPCQEGKWTYLHDGKHLGLVGQVEEIEDDEIYVVVHGSESTGDTVSTVVAQTSEAALLEFPWYEHFVQGRTKGTSSGRSSRGSSASPSPRGAPPSPALSDNAPTPVAGAEAEEVPASGTPVALAEPENQESPHYSPSSPKGNQPLTPEDMRSPDSTDSAPLGAFAADGSKVAKDEKSLVKVGVGGTPLTPQLGEATPLTPEMPVTPMTPRVPSLVKHEQPQEGELKEKEPKAAEDDEYDRLFFQDEVPTKEDIAKKEVGPKEPVETATAEEQDEFDAMFAESPDAESPELEAEKKQKFEE